MIYNSDTNRLQAILPVHYGGIPNEQLDEHAQLKRSNLQKEIFFELGIFFFISFPT
jgi:hypothetical protein